MLSSDTIVAPVTAPGEGGVGIIRLSGPQSLAFLGKAFRGKTAPAQMESHRLYHGHLVDNSDRAVDEVLAVVMRAPNSYTGDEVVEVHGHGGTQVLRGVLDLFLNIGARMAEPGEFTRRAFLNGKLDLAQAEAVVDLIKARSEKAGRVALAQLDGHLSGRIHHFADKLKESLALMEAHIDFPDDEVGALDLDALLLPVAALREDMQQLADSFDLGRALRDGISVLILGKPNVGKSSLMNALLGESRAIVTEVAGTTRDTLEEQLVLAGFPVRLVDAAGVRDTEDPIEQEGVRRAQEKAASADLVLLVVDGSQSLCDEDLLASQLCQPGNTLLVVNKSDQQQLFDRESLNRFSQSVSVSAKHGKGLDRLRDAIVTCLSKEAITVGGEGVVVTERRHRDALQKAVKALENVAVSADSGAPLECLAMDLREALASLGQITGETTPDEILDQIFSRFCIGK